jgi:hypothetical protein
MTSGAADGRAIPQRIRATRARAILAMARGRWAAERGRLSFRRDIGTAGVRNAEASAARNAVRDALAKGDLIRLPCQFCGAVGNVEGHHPSYAADMQLVVTWLCRDHHRQLHKEYRAFLRRGE